MINIFNCKVSKEKEVLSETLKKNVKEYKCGFVRDFFWGFLVVALITFLTGYLNWFSHWFKFTDKEFEIIVTIIGFFGILLGFLLTALGIITFGVQNRFQNETDEGKKTKLNEYWKYLILVSKSVIFLILFYILAFIISLVFIETIKFHDLQQYLMSWSILSTILICILTFDRIFDYYENPF
jgi:uncharacterized membrane protein YidH (DUF202 family)